MSGEMGTCYGISGDAPEIGYFVFGVFGTFYIWDDVLVIWYDLFGDALEMGGYFVFGVFSNACTSNIWDVVLLIWYDSFGICWDLLQCV